MALKRPAGLARLAGMHAIAKPTTPDRVTPAEDAVAEAIGAVTGPESGADPDRMVPVVLGASTRRGFLRGALAVAGGTAAAAALAACAPAAGGAWSYARLRSVTAAAASPVATAAVGSEPESAPQTTEPITGETSTGEPIPEGWTEHDVAAREKVRRFVGNLAPTLGMESYLGTPEQDPEFTLVEHGNQPLEPSVDGDKVRINVTNNLDETTGVHMHGIAFDDFHMDGIPFVTQPPIVPGETFVYEFTATPQGSHMYHSYHNATDQVGRGLLGALIVDPKDPAERYDQKHGVTQEYIFIHNDSLGGFTINGKGFPATVPIIARQGERVLIRYQNEGVMMHPWHTHGFQHHVVARDGAPLGDASFYCDTLGVNPGERFDAIVECDRVGVWAFHCHILPHVEGLDGMFGMVTALVVLPPEE